MPKYFEKAFGNIGEIQIEFQREYMRYMKGGAGAKEMSDGKLANYVGVHEWYHMEQLWASLISDDTPRLEDHTMMYRYRRTWLTLQERKGNHKWHILCANDPPAVHCVWWSLWGQTQLYRNKGSSEHPGRLVAMDGQLLQAQRFSMRKGEG